MRSFYGSKVHPDGEVHLIRYEVQPVHAPTRRERWASYHKAHLRIDLQLTPAEDAGARDPNPETERINRQLLFDAKIQDIIAVYDEDFFSFGLLHNDGSLSRHHLSMAQPNNISGVHVLARQWPRGDGDEYSTVRTAYVVIGALFDTAVSGVYGFSETVRRIGTGGPSWEWVENSTGAPTQQQISQQTRQFIVQSGYIIGNLTWLLGNIPAPLHPTWEKQSRRIEEFFTPVWQGNRYRLYRNEWTYVMEAPPATALTPPTLSPFFGTTRS